MLKVRFDSEKALEAILYVASRAPNPQLYWIGKILYFADRFHLERYGRLITGDHYIAMEYGPVASSCYDILKFARGDGRSLPSGISPKQVSSSISIGDEALVKALRSPDIDYLSRSDITCIDDAIHEFGNMTFGRLCDTSHDNVWKSVPKNHVIPLETIAINCKDGERLVKHLQG